MAGGVAAAGRTPADGSTAPAAGTVRTTITVVWAVAVLLHLLGNPAVVFGEAVPAVSGYVPVVVAVLAGATLLRPGHRPTSLALTVAVWALAAVRLPVLANNLVLLGVTGVALHVSRDDRVAVATVLRAGAAAYLFAAFAKYNTAFLDPAVSCAPTILDRLVASWGLPPAPRAVADATPLLALVVESAVGVGLLVPRLRRHAAALGVAFHGLLAYDLDQHFYDFTAALLPIFAAAAPAVVTDLAARVRQRVPVAPARAAAVVLALLAATTSVALPPTAFFALGHVVWISVGTLAVLGWLAVHAVVRPSSTRVAAARWTPAAVVLVGLVVVNGLTPYTQVKTGYGWNMYSNLRVVDAESNHLLVPALDLRGDHDELLVVVDASSPAVAAYGDRGAALPRVQLVDWVARTPGASVTARSQDGAEVRLEHDTVVRERPAWVVTLAPLRPVVDTCLLGYGPVG